MIDHEMIERRTKTFLNAMTLEAQRARMLFPNSQGIFGAAFEEAGEVAKALTQIQYEPHKGVTPRDVQDECIQAAVMFMRLATEGDVATYPAYDPSDSFTTWADLTQARAAKHARSEPTPTA